MTYEHILLDREDGVGIVTLNRPEVLNAMNRRLMRELADAVKTLDADDEIGCIVVTGRESEPSRPAATSMSSGKMIGAIARNNSTR